MSVSTANIVMVSKLSVQEFIVNSTISVHNKLQPLN